jgi:hypothetical protein
VILMGMAAIVLGGGGPIPTPVIASPSPSSGERGETLTVLINGRCFAKDATVSFSGTGITINSTTRVSSVQLSLSITIAIDAATTARNVTVSNIAGGTNDVASSAFTVALFPAPTNLTAVQDLVTPTTVNLSWTDNSGTETGFEIQRSVADAESWSTIHTTAPSVTTYANTGLAYGSYDYRVRATKSAGTSGWSSTATITLDGDAVTFLEAAEITDPTQRQAISDLVASLKAASLWERMVAIYPFVGGTAAAHKWNLKDPRDLDAAKRLTFAGTLTHSANGVLPNGTNGWANTFVDLNEDVAQYSFHFSYYSRTNTAPDGTDRMLFGSTTSSYYDIYSTGTIDIATGASQPTINLTSQTNFNKLMGFSVYGFDNFNAYRGATQIGTNTNQRYGYWPSGNCYLFCWNNSGTPQLFTNRQCALASFGLGLTPSMWDDFNTIVEAYQTALGRNV